MISRIFNKYFIFLTILFVSLFFGNQVLAVDYSAEYWDTGNATSPSIPGTVADLTTTVSDIDFDWGTGAPVGAGDGFIARWIKTIGSGEYDFSMTSDDGSRFYIDNVLKLNMWVDQGQTASTTSFAITSDTDHTLRVEYYENEANAIMLFSYQRTIYANSTAGNDSTGDGTIASPYKTFYKAYSEAESGDILDLTGTFTWTDADEVGDSSVSGYTIAKNLTIQGAGADQTIIQSANMENTADRRVFTISTTATSTIKNLAIRYGRVVSSNNGGGILNEGNVTFDNVEIYSNRTTGGSGGGISNLHLCQVASSTIYSNSSYYNGGGISNDYYVSDNGYLTITNSTIAYNEQTATTAYTEGGGIHFRQGNGTITNSTIAYNTATGVAGVGMDDNTGTLTIKNTIIANNIDRSNTSFVDFGFRQDGYGNVVDNGNNIVGYSQYYTWAGNTDWTDTNRDGTFVKVGDATTGSLNLESTFSINDNQNNEVITLAISTSTSIAINNGASGTNGAVTVPVTDQRGFGRNSTTDIGAFEYDAVYAVNEPGTQASETIFSSVKYNQATVSWTNGNGSRRVVFMKQANTGTASPVDTTSYSDSSVFESGDQIGSTGWYAIYEGLGTSVSVTNLNHSTDYIVQVFEYNGITPGVENYFTSTATNNPVSQATYSPTTIYANSQTGNDATGNGSSGSPYKTFYKAYSVSNSGDVIDATGIFTWSDADETGDSATTGYTLSNDLVIRGQGADRTIFQADSTDNTADRRIFTIPTTASSTILGITMRYGKVTGSSQEGGALLNQGTVLVRNCEIYNNRIPTGYGGGGLSNQDTMVVENCAVYGNVVYNMGGGILNSYSIVDSGYLTVTNTTVFDNTVTAVTAYTSGGGVYFRQGSGTITNSTIAYNTACSLAGVGMDDNMGILTIKNTVIANNLQTNHSNCNYGAYPTDFGYRQSDYGNVVDNGGNVAGYSSYYTWVGSGDWTDTNRDGIFILYSIGTTGTINLDSSLGYNYNPKKTKTLALQAGSLAIDTGVTGTNGAITVPTLDQRGASRSGTLDLGAYEYNGSFEDPIVLSFSPVDNATSVSKSANLVITFDENVNKETGNIIIYKTSDDSIVETIDVASDLVTGDGTNEITINPVADFAESTEFYIKIDAAAFDDVSGNSYVGIFSTSEWSFTTGDETSPGLLYFSPADNASAVAVESTFEIALNESIATSTGNIILYKSNDDSVVEIIDIADTSGKIIASSTNALIIDPSATLESLTEYYFTIAATAIDDATGNSYAGITASTTWSFTSADISAPTATLSPLDDATNVAIDADIIMTFSEAVDIETGNITLYKTTGDTLVEIFDVTTDVSGNGTALITINSSADLEYETEYYVLVAATAFDDASGNSYAGIAASTIWSFTTLDTPICPTILNAATYNAYPACGVATCNSGYILNSGACVSSGGSSISTPAPAVGHGNVNVAIPMHQTGSAGTVGTKGVNILMYTQATANFSAVVSSSKQIQQHSVKIVNLDLLNNKVEVLIQSEPVRLVLDLEEVQEVDLDNDGISDIRISFTDIVINRVEFTIDSLEKEEAVAELKKEKVAEAIMDKKVYEFTRDLEYGMKGDDVLELQRYLNNNGFNAVTSGPGSKGKETSYFGNVTKNAVIALQNFYNIKPAYGYFGKITQSMIFVKDKIGEVGGSNNKQDEENIIKENEEKIDFKFDKDLYLGIIHEDVLELQKYLNNNGFIVAEFGYGSIGNETEVFGPATRSALIKFQENNKIYPAYGYFGMLTRNFIN